MTDPWNQLRGHHEQREMFRTAMQRGRLSHAVLLCGPQGIGKSLFARLLAQSTFCRETSADEPSACGECRACRSFLAGTWPDYLEVGVPADKTSIPIEAMVGSDENRGKSGLCFELAMAAQASERRVAVIDDADRLNEASANAILKTLEEPPSAALILLIAHQPDALLPTIRSRCQTIRFFGLKEEDVAAILLQEELVEDEAEASRIAAMSDGSIARAQQLISPELRSLKQVIADEFGQPEKIRAFDLTDRVLKTVEALTKTAEEERQVARRILRFTADAVRMRIEALSCGDFSEPLTKSLGVREGIDLLAPILDSVSTAELRINANSPVRLTLESTFDQIARQVRSGPLTRPRGGGASAI